MSAREEHSRSVGVEPSHGRQGRTEGGRGREGVVDRPPAVAVVAPPPLRPAVCTPPSPDVPPAVSLLPGGRISAPPSLAEASGGLVHEQVQVPHSIGAPPAVACRRRNPFAVHLHGVALRNPARRSPFDLSVHGHPSRSDRLCGRSAVGAGLAPAEGKASDEGDVGPGGGGVGGVDGAAACAASSCTSFLLPPNARESGEGRFDEAAPAFVQRFRCGSRRRHRCRYAVGCYAQYGGKYTRRIGGGWPSIREDFFLKGRTWLTGIEGKGGEPSL